MRIFGSTWDAPVCDGKIAEPAPIGEHCLTCDEPIAPGDQGYIMACFGVEEEVEWHPQHRECSLLGIVGHTYDYCHCTDYQGLTQREAAMKVWECVQRDGGRG
jgi:hypothetical protein